jgi:DNA-binding transcriptional regulator PaaX
MMSQRDAATDRRLLGQGRILEALAGDDAVLIGTLERLGRQFGLAPDDLRASLRELVRAGWVAVQTQPFGRVTIRLERRSHEAPPPVTGERRRSVPDAWRL